MAYNLTDRPVCVALNTNGDVLPYSLPELFRNMHNIVDIIAPTPTVYIALFRQLILPTYLHAIGPPRERGNWGERWKRGELDEDELELFDQYWVTHHGRLDLFDSVTPFGQVAELTALNGDIKSTNMLVPHAATGSNVPNFSSHTDDQSPHLDPMDALAWMLHAQCFDTQGLKTGAVGDPATVKVDKKTGLPVVDKKTGEPAFAGTVSGKAGSTAGFGFTVPKGRNLYETVLLNIMVVYDGLNPGDLPQWAQQPPGPAWETRTATGILDLLTWQSRRIRLHHDDTVVTGVVISTGNCLSVLPEIEFHTLWRNAATGKHAAPQWVPKSHLSGKAAWRGLRALVAMNATGEVGAMVRTSDALTGIASLVADGQLGEDYPLRVNICGMTYGTMNSSVLNMISDELPVPVAALTVRESVTRELLLEAVEQAETVRKALDGFQNSIREVFGAKKLDWDKGYHISAEFIAALDVPARRLMTGFQKHSDNDDILELGMAAWETIIRTEATRIADIFIHTVPPGGLIAVGKTTSNVTQARKYLRMTMDKVLPRIKKLSTQKVFTWAQKKKSTARNGGKNTTPKTPIP